LEPRWHSPRAVVGVAVALTVVAALENTVAPWAPFYVVYALLARRCRWCSEACGSRA
jgi:hypothetical protein